MCSHFLRDGAINYSVRLFSPPEEYTTETWEFQLRSAELTISLATMAVRGRSAVRKWDVPTIRLRICNDYAALAVDTPALHTRGVSETHSLYTIKLFRLEEIAIEIKIPWKIARIIVWSELLLPISCILILVLVPYTKNLKSDNFVPRFLNLGHFKSKSVLQYHLTI